MAQVSDSLQLRRFCRIPVIDEVPDESTVRKLTRRFGPEVVDQVTRAAIKEALSHRGFCPRALRADSTVAEADIRYSHGHWLVCRQPHSPCQEGFFPDLGLPESFRGSLVKPAG